jgi:hypothetical protein
VRLALGIVAELIIWLLAFLVLPGFWGGGTPHPVGAALIGFVASTAGFIFAKAAGDAIAKEDRRVHTFALIIAVLWMVVDILLAPLNSVVTWHRVGGIVAAIISWRTSTISLRKPTSQRNLDTGE